jgi:ferredoxin
LSDLGRRVTTDGAPFTVVAQESGKSFDVQPGETIAQKLEETGIHVEISCQSGVCGTCSRPIVNGMSYHRELVQTNLEKASNVQITVCCSRSKTKTLTLDI